MSYVTWGTILVNTSRHGDHVGGGDPSGGDGAPQTEVRVHILDIPVSVGWRTCMTSNLWVRDLSGWLKLVTDMVLQKKNSAYK